jgi:hypothetical protein
LIHSRSSTPHFARVSSFTVIHLRISILFYSILFYSILFYSILFYSILFSLQRGPANQHVRRTVLLCAMTLLQRLASLVAVLLPIIVCPIASVTVCAEALQSVRTSPFTNESFCIRTVVGYAPPSGSGVGPAAPLIYPSAIVIAADGALLALETGNNRIRRIDPNTGHSDTYAGTPQQGLVDGLGAAARFTQPTKMVLTGSGFLVVLDQDSAFFRVVEPVGVVGNVSTWANSLIGLVECIVASRLVPDGLYAVVEVNGDVALFTANLTARTWIQRVAYTNAVYPSLVVAIDDRDNVYFRDTYGNSITMLAAAAAIPTATRLIPTDSICSSWLQSSGFFWTTMLWSMTDTLLVAGNLQQRVYDNPTGVGMGGGQLWQINLKNISAVTCTLLSTSSSIPVWPTPVAKSMAMAHDESVLYFVAPFDGGYQSAVLSLPWPPVADPAAVPGQLTSVIGPAPRAFNDSDGNSTYAQIHSVLSLARAPTGLNNSGTDANSEVFAQAGTVYLLDLMPSSDFTDCALQLRAVSSPNWSVRTLTMPFTLSYDWTILWLLIGPRGEFFVTTLLGIQILQLRVQDHMASTIPFVGNEWQGQTDGYGTNAQFTQIITAASVPDCSVWFVVDHYLVRQVDVTTALVTTVAGSDGSEIAWISPGQHVPMGFLCALAVWVADASSSVLFVAAYQAASNVASYQIFRVDGREGFNTTLYAGTMSDYCEPPYVDGPALSVCIGGVTTMLTDVTGQLYFFDSSTNQLRLISLDGMVTSLIGAPLSMSNAPAIGYVDAVGLGAMLPEIFILTYSLMVAESVVGQSQMISLETENGMQILLANRYLQTLRLIMPASNCSAGSYSPSLGQCVECSLGSFCPTGSMSENKCPTSFYCPQANVSLPCPVGAWCAEGSIVPTPCPSGNWCPGDTSAPFPCPAGRYGNVASLTTNDCSGLCTLGHYCVAGTSDPTPCPALTFGDKYGLFTAACSGLCFMPGYACPPGTWNATSHPCPPGTASNMAPVPECPRCPPGQFSTSIASHTCSACNPPDIVSPNRDNCDAGPTCAAGHHLQFAANYTAFDCLLCAPGTYMNLRNHSEQNCFPAPPDTYAPGSGCVEPYPCGGLDGVYCSNGLAHPLTGWYMYENDQSTGEVCAMPCLRGYCNEDSQRRPLPTLEDQCGVGRLQASSNTLCGQCAEGYAVSAEGDSCVPNCSAWRGFLIFTALLSCWLLVMVLHVLAQRASDNALLSIVLYYAQTGAVIAGDSGYMAGSIDFLNAAPHTIVAPHGACIGPMDTAQQLGLQLAVVLIMFSQLLLTAFIHACAQQRCGCAELRVRLPFRASSYIRSVTVLFMFCFIKLLMLALRSIYCTHVGSSISVLYYTPAIQCGSHQHIVWLGTIMAVLAAMLIALAYIGMRSRALVSRRLATSVAAALRDESVDGDDAETSKLPAAASELTEAATELPGWSVLIEPYRDGFMWYSGVVLARKVTLVAVDTYLALHSADRLLAFNVLHVVSVALHWQFLPYRSRVENNAETAALLLLGLFSALMQAHPAVQATDAIYRVMLVVSVVLMAVPSLGCVLYLLLPHLRVIRRTLRSCWRVGDRVEVNPTEHPSAASLQCRLLPAGVSFEMNNMQH